MSRQNAWKSFFSFVIVCKQSKWKRFVCDACVNRSHIIFLKLLLAEKKNTKKISYDRKQSKKERQSTVELLPTININAQKRWNENKKISNRHVACRASLNQLYSVCIWETLSETSFTTMKLKMLHTHFILLVREMRDQLNWESVTQLFSQSQCSA